MNRRWAAAILAAVATLATGCSGTSTAGIPTPQRPETSPPAQSHRTSDVPKVDRPLVITSFLDEPCTSLTDDQVTEYLGEDTEEDDKTNLSAGPSCAWYSGMRSNAHISVTYPRLGDDGLAAIYLNKEHAAYFLGMAPASGYPAIASSTIDKRDEGECLVTVGTSDSEYVHINMYLGDGSVGRVDPCDAAHEVATAVIDNIKETN
ncbi:DUF3558 domain-containing protein [Saccharomonospora azurea]|uniref:DUF3558 domain-containing protein n=1 Tax=Saccharomonospora azurea TaxID=40988 RepID=UPI00331A7879